jgi:cell division initiation protein
MSITPIAIRTVDLRRAVVGGYRRQEVDDLLDEIADDFAAVARERDQLSERLNALEAEGASHRELETLLRSTLVSAESAAQDVKAQARRESDLIVQEAHAESRRVTREAAAERRSLEEEMIGIRARLRAALQTLTESAGAVPTTEREATAMTPALAIEEALESGIREVAA